MRNVVDFKTRRPLVELLPHPVFHCSFVRRRNRDLWAVEPVGRHTPDFERGQQIAVEFLAAHVSRRPGQGNFATEIVMAAAKKFAADPRHESVLAGFLRIVLDYSIVVWTPGGVETLRGEVDRAIANNRRVMAEVEAADRERRSSAAKKAARTRASRASAERH